MNDSEPRVAFNCARYRLVVWFAKIIHELLLLARPSVNQILIWGMLRPYARKPEVQARPWPHLRVLKAARLPQ